MQNLCTVCQIRIVIGIIAPAEDLCRQVKEIIAYLQTVNTFGGNIAVSVIGIGRIAVCLLIALIANIRKVERPCIFRRKARPVQRKNIAVLIINS